MAKPRLELQQILKDLDGSIQAVYFQPPSNVKMQYPCIVYNLSNMVVQYADNRPHRSNDQYTVTVIDRDPDSVIRKKIAVLPYCSFNRFFVADNLNHFVFTLYF